MRANKAELGFTAKSSQHNISMRSPWEEGHARASDLFRVHLEALQARERNSDQFYQPSCFYDDRNMETSSSKPDVLIIY